MKPSRMRPLCAAMVFLAAASLQAGQWVLDAAKDTFARSNAQIRNNGGSAQLHVAHAPNIRTLVAFDLSAVTNRIEGAALRIRMVGDAGAPPELVVAPMVQTGSNAAWGEGSGALGAKGRNAQPGESCHAFSAFRDVRWEAAGGQPLANLADPRLWEAPAASLRNVEWRDGQWLTVRINGAARLEAIRASDAPVATFGVWGTSGRGLYAFAARESGQGPQLVLDTKDETGGAR